MRNKGQAAMEFLMTYGWAILIVVIAVAALAAFGVFNPQQFAQERCVGDATEFACASSQAAIDLDATPQTVSFELANGVGDTVNITSIDASDDGDCGTATASFDGNSTISLQPNDEFIATVECSNTISEGGVFQDTFTLNYDIVDGLDGLSGTVEVVVMT